MSQRRTNPGPPAELTDVVPPIFGPSLNAELAQYGGRWVAVDDAGQRVIAVGDTAAEVFAAAHQAQMPDALIVRVPADPDVIHLL